MKAFVLFAVLGACTYDTTESSIWTLHTGEATCPSPDDVSDVLVETWGTPGVRIDGDACQLAELVEIAPAIRMRTGESCCYAATCSVELSTHDRITVFDALCLGLSCEDLNTSDTGFSAAKAAQNLADAGLACTVDPSTVPATQSDRVCEYPVTGVYECSSEPG
jgi:hypothetical protein